MNIIWIENRSKVQERENFVNIKKDFGVIKFTIAFKISVIRIVDKY